MMDFDYPEGATPLSKDDVNGLLLTRIFRQREVTIGRPWELIPEELKHLFDDVRGWMEYSSYSHDEIGVRFHHRLTLIHPFPNGNGRHARLMADLLVENVLGQPYFTWGRVDLTERSSSRSKYIQALYTADNEFDYGPLLDFARS